MSVGPILLVADDPDDVRCTVRAFTENDARTEMVVAHDGAEALRLLFAGSGGHPLSPALVLLDVRLPKAGGLEVLRTIRADDRTRSLPVVVLTTSSEERDILDSYRLGANGFVHKPPVFEEFVAVADVLARYWLRINQPAPTARVG